MRSDLRRHRETRELGAAIYLEPLSPIIDFPLGPLLRVPITLLKEFEQFGIFAFDEFKILISQLAPLPFGFAFQLVPAAFDFVPAHGAAPFVASKSDHIHRYSQIGGWVPSCRG